MGSQIDWDREAQETGTHKGPLAVVQVGSNGDLNWECGEEEEATDGGERDWGGIINSIWELILHVCTQEANLQRQILNNAQPFKNFLVKQSHHQQSCRVSFNLAAQPGTQRKMM